MRESRPEQSDELRIVSDKPAYIRDCAKAAYGRLSSLTSLVQARDFLHLSITHYIGLYLCIAPLLLVAHSQTSLVYHHGSSIL